jgi:DNA-binding HxlR family transcriptional regulator
MSVSHTEVTHSAQAAKVAAALDPCGLADHPDCGIRDVLNRVGDKWSVLVVVELASGVRRFRELQRAIDGISQRMLTLTVRRLERDGLVTRTVYPTVPAQVTYELTARGASLTHLVKQLADWSLAHRDAIAQSRQDYDTTNPDHAIR